MKLRLIHLLCLLVLLAAVALIVSPVAGQENVTETLTFVTAPPITEPTTIPTTIPTTVPTTEQTTEPTTIPTTIPTMVPTTEQTTTSTVTITLEPTGPGGGKGWIDTFCNVDGATVYFDGVPQGTIAGGMLSVAVSPTGSPVRTVSASLAGYTTGSADLPRMPAAGEHVQAYITINPVPTPTTIPPVQNGAIYASSSPAGAAIYMNGNFYGYSPITLPNIAPGIYSMKAALTGYTPDTQIIAVNAGQTAPYYPILQPSPPPPRSTGDVTVTSNTGAASVYFDGNYYGKSPITVSLYPGTHTIRASLSGYSDYTTSVIVTAGSRQTVSASLTPAVYGQVAVSSLPGANVYLDSAAIGTIPSSGTLVISSAPNGNHIFRVSATGYNDWINTVYVVPNTVTSINAMLVPVGVNPSPQPVAGGINIVSTPAGAEIYIDTFYRGNTPQILNGIPAGQHIVMLRYTGYVDYTASSVVNPGQVTPLAIAMTPAPTPTPTPFAGSPPLFIAGALAVVFAISAELRRRT